MNLFLAFVGVSTVIIVTPGPDTAITIRNTLFGGRAGGIFTALGVSCGLTIWAIADQRRHRRAAGGVGAAVPRRQICRRRLSRLSRRPRFARGNLADRRCDRAARRRSARPPAATPLAAFRQGLISDLGNPKIAVFFASLLPQFVPAGSETFSALLLLGVVFALMTFIWLTLYAA